MQRSRLGDCAGGLLQVQRELNERRKGLSEALTTFRGFGDKLHTADRLWGKAQRIRKGLHFSAQFGRRLEEMADAARRSLL